jgi:hypothetical protein
VFLANSKAAEMSEGSLTSICEISISQKRSYRIGGEIFLDEIYEITMGNENGKDDQVGGTDVVWQIEI